MSSPLSPSRPRQPPPTQRANRAPSAPQSPSLPPPSQPRPKSWPPGIASEGGGRSGSFDLPFRHRLSFATLARSLGDLPCGARLHEVAPLKSRDRDAGPLFRCARRHVEVTASELDSIGSGSLHGSTCSLSSADNPSNSVPSPTL